jgi:D-alanine--poly(phosphoribitol) ligase subunit 2
MDRVKITQAIYEAVDEINQFRPAEEHLEKNEATVLHGRDGQLDSLGIVNLIVATEMNLEMAFGVSVNLADEKAMARPDSPFRTVGTFADYIESRLEEKINGARSL